MKTTSFSCKFGTYVFFRGHLNRPTKQLFIFKFCLKKHFSLIFKKGPHVCPDCGQGFNGLGNMKRHFRVVHEGVKDFACQFCPKRFGKPDNLKNHEMTHTVS